MNKKSDNIDNRNFGDNRKPEAYNPIESLRLYFDIAELLSRRINIADIRSINEWAAQSPSKREFLLDLALAGRDRKSVNALWCIAQMHGQKAWLQSKQSRLIDSLLEETHTSKKRILLQLLRHQDYTRGSLRTDFLDYCLAKINSKCEAYAVRSNCIYCAFKMCCIYPELMNELCCQLDMLSRQNLSPGLACALKNTRADIGTLDWSVSLRLAKISKTI